MENGDAERRMVSLHAKEHRGHIYLYALFSQDFYTPGALRLAYDVTSRCPNCAQMKQRKRVRCSRPNLTAGHMNSWAVDMKGPIMVGSSKKYVFCGVETNLRRVHFAIAESLEAKEIARLIFEGIIASYGSSIEIISDRGKSFLNKLNQALFTLGSVHHRLTDAYQPQSSIFRATCGEEIFVINEGSHLQAESVGMVKQRKVLAGSAQFIADPPVPQPDTVPITSELQVNFLSSGLGDAGRNNRVQRILGEAGQEVPGAHGMPEGKIRHLFEHAG